MLKRYIAIKNYISFKIIKKKNGQIDEYLKSFLMLLWTIMKIIHGHITLKLVPKIAWKPFSME